MIYWKVQFDDGGREGTTGYLVLDDSMTNSVLKDENGNDVKDAVSYHPIDTENVTPPAWAQ
jgi:hypothetical protein